jgi:Zn finger protein HypA/HybF involved in hydrogenase expression
MSEVEITPEKRPFQFACHHCHEAYDNDKHKPLIVCP